MRRLAVLLIAVACAGGCAIAPTSAKWREKSDALLAAQTKAAEQAKATGGDKVIFAACALNSESTAFQGDAIRARDALRSLNPANARLRAEQPARDFRHRLPVRHQAEHRGSAIARRPARRQREPRA